jgi:hypothetical protein
MRREQRHRGGVGVVYVCSKDRWLSPPLVDGRHWSLMGGCEPLPVKRKEATCLLVSYIVLTS